MEIIQNTNHLEERSWLRQKSNKETLNNYHRLDQYGWFHMKHSQLFIRG